MVKVSHEPDAVRRRWGRRLASPPDSQALLGILVFLHYANALLFLGFPLWQAGEWVASPAPRGGFPLTLAGGVILITWSVVNFTVAEGLRRRSLRAARAAVVLWALAIVGAVLDQGRPSGDLFWSVLILGAVLVQWRRFEAGSAAMERLR